MGYRILAIACLLPSLAFAYTFPIKASANGRYFVDQTNTPFLLIGDAPMSIVSLLTVGQQTTYLADRQAKGYNAVEVDLLCASYTGCASSGKTAGNVAPFTSGSSPGDYDFSTPNATYFALYTAFVDLAATYGIVVFLDPAETGSWLAALDGNGSTRCFNYGVYIGNLFKNKTNLVWYHGNDFAVVPNSSFDDGNVGQVMAGIISVDTSHLQTIEVYDAAWQMSNITANPSMWSLFPASKTAFGTWLTADLTYTYAPTYDANYLAYNSTPTMPCFLGEGNYEFEALAGGLSGTTGVYVLRETAYWTITAGCNGYLYGNHYVWPSTWPANQATELDTPGAAQIQYINTLFAQLNWWALVPDQAHTVVTAGYGTYTTGPSDLRVNTYCSAESAVNTGLVAYCPNSTTLTVDMTKFNGSITARKYDPSNGAFTTYSGSPFANTGTHNFAMTGNNNDGNGDWVLLLQASGSGLTTTGSASGGVKLSGAIIQ